MNDRKHCTECDTAYSDEASHQLVHEAVLATAQPAEPPGSGEIPQP